MVQLAETEKKATGTGIIETIMPTFHIHIQGRVQGVGFRPFVKELAAKLNLKGWVLNSGNGVEINVNFNENILHILKDAIYECAPENALITGCSITKIKSEHFEDFKVLNSSACDVSDVLLPPDTGMCASCKAELFDPKNRRYRYPFITCLHCGPRYSILGNLPYDRENTSMAHLEECESCKEEYHEPGNSRQHSQTQSCPDCAIKMHLYDSKGKILDITPENIPHKISSVLLDGKIVAVKGIGGYLLFCDATNADAIALLRTRKRRKFKPLAVMYPDIKTAIGDVCITETEKKALESKEAPIVICLKKQECKTGISYEDIAPGLDSIGVLLPYNPLFCLISEAFKKPLVATSANLSGAPIIYRDDEAVRYLPDIADFILTYDREILFPQDDSVLRFSGETSIILRRSRGMAPAYYPNPIQLNHAVFAAGAELKGSFAFNSKNVLLVSQYLGNQSSFESQKAFERVKKHLQKIYALKPDHILADTHPGYEISLTAEQLSAQHDAQLRKIQHHEAHFAAVLAENELLQSEEDVLGVIWDGTGYGIDGQIWGGEFFTLKNTTINRLCHLDYFPLLSGDKMAREPRLSALSLLKGLPKKRYLVESNFNKTEFDFYDKLLEVPQAISTSSMGRLFDGVASLLNICQYNNYEGEAGGRLEALARSGTSDYAYPIEIEEGIINWRPLISAILDEISAGSPPANIARAFIRSLAQLVFKVAEAEEIKTIACSGGVFQNALLVDFLQELKPPDVTLLFHKQLSPNDECISFGQMAHFTINQQEAVSHPQEQLSYA